MDDHSLDSAPLLTHAVQHLFEHGVYVGPERTFDERYKALFARARLLGEAGRPIIEFMENSVKEYEPLLRAINDLGLLAAMAKNNSESANWKPIADRVRTQLIIADKRYVDPRAVEYSVKNLTDVLNDAIELFKAREQQSSI